MGFSSRILFYGALLMGGDMIVEYIRTCALSIIIPTFPVAVDHVENMSIGFGIELMVICKAAP